MPGHRIDRRFSNGVNGVSSGRFAAAQHFVELADQGKRPTIAQQATTTHQSPRTGLHRIVAGTDTYAHLVPDLKLSLANLVRAAEAMARLAQLGWVPLAGYPGADQPWHMECRLCGWQGHRFWSHWRGRNGNGIPRPVNRHPGCIPVADHAQALVNLAAERRHTCPCPQAHPTDYASARGVLLTARRMITEDGTTAHPDYARRILEPCPAATLRAESLREALVSLTQLRPAWSRPKGQQTTR
ncbi:MULTISPECIES: hypothetical protein [unclassified Streptomyces]|uniref:hypothetical protein n=1 Tax=unclassified Streptomyces TaxID=2593676 RepID=UPI0011B938A2|nr:MULTISPECIES: hypothetical protein [unclassified Streptomyces]MYT71193.1 hypothetical protein [Streptomyces sp. SID8367]